MQWKSLDMYNYFQSGHVHDVKLWAISSDKCILKALVNPSQQAADQAHETWIAVNLQFKVESALQNGYTTATSNMRCWKQVSTKKVRHHYMLI